VSLGKNVELLQILDPGEQVFAVKFGELDYGAIPEPRPELKMHLWLFAPLPAKWKALGGESHPSVLQDDVVRHEGGGTLF
jgi:hypothetical protein